MTVPVAMTAFAPSSAVAPAPVAPAAVAMPPAPLPAAVAELATEARRALAHGDDATAITALETATRQCPQSAELWSDLALAHIGAQHSEPALAAAERALALAPDNAAAWCSRARALLRLQRIEETRAALEQAQALAPTDPLILTTRATLLMLEGDSATAHAVFQQARTADPLLAEAAANHAQLLLRDGQTGPALQAIRLAVSLRPMRASLRYLLGRTLMKSGQENEASVALQEAIRLDPTLIPARVDLSDLLRRQNRPHDAETVCRQGLEQAPTHLGLQVNLAAAMQEQFRTAEARSLYQQILAQDATIAAVHSNLAKIAEDGGDLETAARGYRQAALLAPDNPDFARFLAQVEALQASTPANSGRSGKSAGETVVLSASAGPLPDPLAAHRLLFPPMAPPPAAVPETADGISPVFGLLQAPAPLSLTDDDAATRMLQAHKLAESGDSEAAQAVYQEIVRLNPRHANALLALGVLQIAAEKLDGAESTFRQLAQHYPTSFVAYANLGNIHKLRGNIVAALTAFRQAHELNPGSAEVLCNYALTLNLRTTWRTEAEQVLRQALAIRPEMAAAWSNLGIVAQQAGRLSVAETLYRRALTLQPDDLQTINNLSIVLANLNRFQEADTLLAAACAQDPTFPQISSNRVFFANYCPEITPAELYARHCQWDARHGCGLIPRDPLPPRSRDPHRRLTIGFVSPDFGQHPVGFFSVPLFAHLDRNAFSIVAYSQRGSEEPTTAILRQHAALWRQTLGMSNADLAQRIRADGVDILVDLGGHTGGQRLAVFARKPAPIQITWLGYPNTTGLATMDYRITDAIADPPGSDAVNRETLIRLPRGFHCYAPSPDWPEPGPLPALAAGYVTFGTFNNLMKVTPAILALWARILDAVPGSRFWLKSYQLSDPVNRGRVRGLFAAHGIDSRRIDIRPWFNNPLDHLTSFRSLDIALDTSPYNGTTTTCDALWMGVPVVTLTGDRHAARVGMSLLTHAGYPELVTHTADDYVALAVSLARDLPRLAALRSTLRERMRNSPLNDGPGFARIFGDALRMAWQRWCAQPDPAPSGLPETAMLAAGQQSPAS